ncbi:FGGY-family carbohydrate kinase [Deinococcus altitudinis]|uniref:xylulokinase n=1 Tax=Deinococcus altitudinis TaxID=468914 RepID=UPI003892A54F
MKPEELVAAIDVGSGAVKGVVLGRSGRLWAEHTVALATHEARPGHAEQAPQDWWAALEEICRAWACAGVPLTQLRALTMTGQMQDVILSRGGRATVPALLYSDVRAIQEVAEVEEVFGDARLGDVAAQTGNPHTAASVLPKLLWLRRHAPELLAGRPRLHVGAKDLLTEQLTGVHLTDHTTAATTGLYDLSSGRWHLGWPARLGLDLELPELRWPTELAGRVQEQAAARLGLPAGLPVLTGLGDAGATTLGAGVGLPGERYAYLGTSGWLGAVIRDLDRPADGFRLPLLGPGTEVPNPELPNPELPGSGRRSPVLPRPLMPSPLMTGPVLTVSPLTNAGSAHRWAAVTFAAGDYGRLERLMEEAAASDLLCLPYLAGERSPVQDPHARGVFVGVGPETGPGMLARAVLEGVAYALRATAEGQGEPAATLQNGPLPLLGGGSRSAVWCQILADVFRTPVKVPARAALLPVFGAAYAAFVYLGWSVSYEDYRRDVLRDVSDVIVQPDPERADWHDRQFGRFQRVYPAVSSLF